MEKTVIDARTNILENINTLFNDLEVFSKGLDEKFEKVSNMKGEIDEKHKDIDSFKKVSFIASMDKQLSDKNKTIELLEKRIKTLTLKNEKLTKKLGDITNQEDDVEDQQEEEQEEEQEQEKEQEEDIWQIKEFEGTKYLFNSDTNKIHFMQKNESPGDIIGRITSKGKFKKYDQPKAYC